MRALRQIDPRARLADLVVLGLIAADKTLPTGAVKASIDHEGAQCDVFKAKSQTDTGAYTRIRRVVQSPSGQKTRVGIGAAGVGANATKAQKIKPKRDPLRPRSTKRIV